MLNTQLLFNKTTIPISKLSFSGINPKIGKEYNQYLLAFDLDGTFLECQKADVKKFLELAKSQNHKLAFVSGRNKDEFEKIKAEYKEKGIDIPMPDYYLTCNGQFIYENKAGKLILDEEYYNIIAQTGFQRDKYSHLMNDLANKLQNGLDSKLVEIKFRPSEFNLEYVVDSKLKKSITKTVLDHINSNNLQGKVILDYVSPESVQNAFKFMSPELISKINPLLDKDGGAVVFNLSATNKGNAVEFLKNKLGINSEKVITAGNAGNDYSLAKSGFIFIMVKNAENILKELIKGISENIKTNIVKAQNNGLAGINETLERIFNKN